MTVEGRDSAFPPTPDQLEAAQQAGVRIWGGYMASNPRMGLYHLWTPEDFNLVRQLGTTPIAFCSGWDDPLWVLRTAAEWGVRACLDVEAGIRPDGAWVADWLRTSGAGLYGSWAIHPGRDAAFHVLAAYPRSGDPFGASWWVYSSRPPGPCIWQWAGTHREFGLDCDSWWADDDFAPPDPAPDPHVAVAIPEVE